MRPILLVEDNPDDEALTVRALRKNGISNAIVVAHDGVEAIARLFGGESGQVPALKQLPQVVLLDIKLPRIDGIAVLRRIRETERTTDLPVVMLTSSNEPQDLVASYELRANSYVRKPVVFEEFMEAVGRLGRYWLLNNEPPPID